MTKPWSPNVSVKEMVARHDPIHGAEDFKESLQHAASLSSMLAMSLNDLIKDADRMGFDDIASNLRWILSHLFAAKTPYRAILNGMINGMIISMINDVDVCMLEGTRTRNPQPTSSAHE